jgi:hypothetical protein
MRQNRDVLLAVAAIAVSIAGCGSSRGQTGTNAAGISSGIKFADCMRANGIAGFQDPGGGGGGIAIPSGVNPASPAFQKAQHACQRLLPSLGGPAQATAHQKKMLLTLSRCMRAHGVTGFTDPVSSAPSSPVGLALAFGRPGAFIVISQTLNPRSPRFIQAGRICGMPGEGRPVKGQAP